MKIIIVGAGKIGKELTRVLANEDHDITVIDTNQTLVDNIVNVYDVMGVCGNGATEEVLHEAGIDSSDILIAATSSDEVNMLTCLVAKRCGIKHTVARVRNPEYEKQNQSLSMAAGISLMINPEKAAAIAISRILRMPNIVTAETFCSDRFELVEYRITDKEGLDGVKLSELYGKIKVKVLVCAVRRNHETIIPSGDFELHTGDIIYITASPANLGKFFRTLGIFKKKASDIMIIGGGRISYYLSKQMSNMAVKVTVIDNDLTACNRMSQSLPQTLVINGDGTDPELLREEGIQFSDAFVALTGVDETNIITCMIASKISDCKVIAKISKNVLYDFVDQDNLIDSVISPARVTAESILEFVKGIENAEGTRIRALHQLAHGSLQAIEFLVTKDVSFVNIPFAKLKFRSGILVAGIVRGSEVIIPSGNDVLLPGDDVVIVTTDHELNDIREIAYQGEI